MAKNRGRRRSGEESGGTGGLPTMGEDSIGSIFQENTAGNEGAGGTLKDISGKYHNLQGGHGTTDVDIQALARGIKNVVENREFTGNEFNEVYKLDKAFGLETYYDPFERQVLNKINRQLAKNGSVSTSDVTDYIVDSYIYQYNKEYMNQRDTNKFLRTEFKDDLNAVIDELD